MIRKYMPLLNIIIVPLSHNPVLLSVSVCQLKNQYNFFLFCTILYLLFCMRTLFMYSISASAKEGKITPFRAGGIRAEKVIHCLKHVK